MLSYLANLIMTPFAIVFSYAAVGTWLLCQIITNFGVVPIDDTKSEISITDDLTKSNDERACCLLERENNDLREANQQWFEKYEELHAENKELKSEVRQVRTMLYTVGCISMIMLWSYGLIAYAYILGKGLAK